MPPMPNAGENPVITGALVTTKELVLVTEPCPVTTRIGPLLALDGTVARICVGAGTEKVTASPLNCTAVTPVKLAPSIKTPSPGATISGEKLSIMGPGPVTVKLSNDVAFPARDSTRMGPFVAPKGTREVIWVGPTIWKAAGTPSNCTDVT